MTRTNGDAAAGHTPGWLRRFAVTATALTAVGLAVVCAVCWIPIWPCTLSTAQH